MTRRGSPGAQGTRNETGTVGPSSEEAALDRAVRRLARSARSSRELRDELLGHGFDEETVRRVLDRLESLRHLDDRELASDQALVLLNSKGHSPGAIREALSARGIDSTLIEDALEAAIDGKDEATLCVSALRKRLGSTKLTVKTAPRYVRALARLGWSEDAIRRALDLVHPGLSDELERAGSTASGRFMDGAVAVDVIPEHDAWDSEGVSTLRRRARRSERGSGHRGIRRFGTEAPETWLDPEGESGVRPDGSGGDDDPW